MKDPTLPFTFKQINDVTMHADFCLLLERIGLDCFDAFWNFDTGETIKQIPERSLIRFSVDIHGEKTYFYLKRHNLEFAGIKKLLSFFCKTIAISQGIIEFNHICDLKNHGIETVIPVAAGEKFFGPFKAASFLLTLDVSPYISLEYLLEENPDFFSGEKGLVRKNILIKELALLARKMHNNGLNHRDFNATHILLLYDHSSNRASGIPKLALFDLQRVDKKKFLRFFWTIKSMAGLIYTLPKHLFNETDRYSLFLSYKEDKKLNALDKLQWRMIKRKIHRIRCHVKKAEKKRKHA
jgi:heptose I phosphotransferase